MNIKRILLAAVAVTVLAGVIGGLSCGLLFNWVYAIEPTNVWTPIEEMSWGKVYLGLFLLDIVLVYVYSLLKSAVPGKTKVVKGIVFGVIVWAVGMLPGMLSTYFFMTVATQVVIYWTISGVIVSILKGIVMASIIEK